MVRSQVFGNGIWAATLSVMGVVAFGASPVRKSAQLPAALDGVLNAAADRVPGEFIVNFRDVPGVRAADTVQSMRPQLEALGLSIIRSYRASPAVLVKTLAAEGSATFAWTLKALRSDPRVKSVEANAILRTLAAPNDDRFGEQYPLQNLGQTGGTSGADIGAIEAWNITTGSRDVVVGIIDTGIDHTHPDLVDNIWKNPGETGLDANGRDKATNSVDDDGNGYVDDVKGWDFANNDNNPMDDQGHGTHTSGTIGASGNNRVGITGVNWQVSLVGIKFLGSDGSGTLDGAIQSIEYATGLGVKLTSNSWGGGGYSDAMASAIREAGEKGILFVAAAGNEANDNDAAPTYPATYGFDNIIAVAATNHSDAMAYFSNYGKKTVHVAAPGVDVLSTVPGGKYEQLSGTSMACPHVSGAAALIWSVFPQLDYRLIKTRLINNVTQLDALGSRTAAAGRLSLPAALERDERAPGQPGAAQVLSAGLFTADIDWAVTGDDGLEGRASAYEIHFIQQPDAGQVPTLDSWSTSPIIGVVSDRPGESSIPFTIQQVADDFKGFLSVRAVDNVGNRGSFSSPTFVQLADRVVVASLDADTATGITFEGSWGTEQVEGHGLVFSDSPKGDYEQGVNASMILAPVDIDLSKESYLTFFAKQDLEPSFDFGLVEVRRSERDSWTTLAKHSGSQPWRKEILRLPKDWAGQSALQIRFRMTTDRSVDFEGWLIDGISLVQVP